MRIHISHKAAFLIFALFSGTLSAATYTKTATMPPASSVLGSGTPNMAAGILEVGMAGVEYIPSSASESRAVANVTKGLRVPTSGIVSSLKQGIRGGLPGLAVNGVIAGLAAGVGWVITEGGKIEKAAVPGDQPVPTTAGQYQWSNGSGGYTASSAKEGCDLTMEASVGSNWNRGTTTIVSFQPDGSGATCHFSWPAANMELTNSTFRKGSGCPANSQYSSTVGACLSVGSTPGPLLESDLDVLDGFVQGKDGVWQRGLADEICKGSLNYEGCVQGMGAIPYVAGPSTASSPEVTTQSHTQNADGTSTEVSTKTRTDYSLGYPSSAPGTISIDPKTTTTTTTTTKDANGTVTSTGTTTGTSTSTQPGSGTELADGNFTDTPFPDVGPFYKQQFPGGFKDVWAKNKAAFDSSPFVSFLHSFVPSFSGSCPTWSLSFDIMAYAHFGSRQFGSLCYIFDIIKVIMLVTAMFTCRSIIFGG